MSIYRKLFVIILMLCGNLQGQLHDPIINFADELFIAEEYENAITEYKRFIYFNQSSEYVSYAYFKIGLAFRNQQQWHEAIEALQYSIFTAHLDSIKEEREIALAIILLASGDYSGAEIRLLKTQINSEISSVKRKAVFFQGIACLYSHKWRQAKIAFENYFTNDSTRNAESMAGAIDSILANALTIKYKSPRFAKLLSTILPGSGQLYAGDFADGFNAMTINGFTSYLLFSSLAQGNYTNTFLSYFFVFNRYYLGNRNHAAEVAEIYNANLNKEISENLLRLLSDN